jgi:hypothetical protein
LSTDRQSTGQESRARAEERGERRKRKEKAIEELKQKPRTKNLRGGVRWVDIDDVDDKAAVWVQIKTEAVEVAAPGSVAIHAVLIGDDEHRVRLVAALALRQHAKRNRREKARNRIERAEAKKKGRANQSGDDLTAIVVCCQHENRLNNREKQTGRGG